MIARDCQYSGDDISQHKLTTWTDIMNLGEVEQFLIFSISTFTSYNKTWQRGLTVSRRELGREFFDQFLVVSSWSDPSSDPLIRFGKKVLVLCLSKVWPSHCGKHQIYHYILYHISYLLPACGTTRRGCPCWPSGYWLDIAKVEKLHIYCRGCYDDVCIRTDIIIGIGINIDIKFWTIEIP